MIEVRYTGARSGHSQASNEELQDAVKGMRWRDKAQEPAADAALDLAALTPEQLQQVAAQLLTLVEQGRGDGTDSTGLR